MTIPDQSRHSPGGSGDTSTPPWPSPQPGSACSYCLARLQPPQSPESPDIPGRFNRTVPAGSLAGITYRRARIDLSARFLLSKPRREGSLRVALQPLRRVEAWDEPGPDFSAFFLPSWRYGRCTRRPQLGCPIRHPVLSVRAPGLDYSDPAMRCFPWKSSCTCSTRDLI